MRRIGLYAALLLMVSACTGGNQHEGEQSDVEVPSKNVEVATHEADADKPHIIGNELSYKADGVTMHGYLAYDENIEGERPGVLVVHEWWGHNEHTRNAAEKLAEAGYVAFALDMYGDGKTADHPEDAKAFSSSVMSNFDGAKARFNAAMEVLKQTHACDEDQLAAIGYCFGGGVVLNMARQGADLDAVATFHGSIGAIEPATPGSVKARLLVMNGADDPFVSDEAIEAFKAEMDAAGVDYEFINYPDAVHAFTNPVATAKGKEFDLPLAYNEQADTQSWNQLEAFLEATFQE